MAAAYPADLGWRPVTAPSFGSVPKAKAAGAAGAGEAIRYPEGAISWGEFEARTAALARRLIDLCRTLAGAE
jgi:hypothetical protein